MAEGGRPAYFGSLQHCSNYFKHIGLACPTNFNPADFYINSLALKPSQMEQSTSEINDICRRFIEDLEPSILADNGVMGPFGGEVGYQTESQSDVGQKFSKSVRSRPKLSWYREVWLIGKMVWLCNLRNKSLNLMRILQRLFIAGVIASLYSGVDLSCPNQDLNGLLFTFVTESTFNVIYGFLWEFPGSLAIARRDVSDGLYRPWTFFMAKHLAFWPLILPEAILVTAVTFSSVTLNLGPAGFVYLCGLSFLLGICSAAHGGMLSLAFKDFVASGITVETLHGLLLNVGGFYMSLATIPVYFVWVKYISLFFYGFVLLASYIWTSVGAISCSTSSGAVLDASVCLKDGADVLKSMAITRFDEASLLYFPCFAALIFLLYVVGFLLLKKRLKEFAD